jgi:pimeloyl-ACP methyl ester carboxylesterase
MTTQPEFAMVPTNGITLRVALAGKGPLVVMVHGWPESWYSWRHQITALAQAGYRVAAPDVRGYGGSDKPEAIEAYAIKDICADIAGLVEALGERQAILIGHDWGAPIVWNTALFYPDKVRAVAGLSVPHTGRGPAPRIAIFRTVYKDRFFYQIYFQEPGVAEAELEANVRTTLRKTYYGASGEGRKAKTGAQKPVDAKYLDGLVDPDPFPAWLTSADLDYYVGEFERSGFRGPLNRYRTSELGPPHRATGRLHRGQPRSRAHLRARHRPDRTDARDGQRSQAGAHHRRRRSLDPAGAPCRGQRGAAGVSENARLTPRAGK